MKRLRHTVNPDRSLEITVVLIGVVLDRGVRDESLTTDPISRRAWPYSFVS